jgi:hypothetical protein
MVLLVANCARHPIVMLAKKIMGEMRHQASKGSWLFFWSACRRRCKAACVLCRAAHAGALRARSEQAIAARQWSPADSDLRVVGRKAPSVECTASPLRASLRGSA